MRRLLEAAARVPRVSSAICFGAAATVTTHFMWIADTRLSGRTPMITLGAGLAHAGAAVMMGRRLMNRSRTRTASEARVLGAVISLIAWLLFSISLASWLESSNAARHGAFSFVALVPFVAFFSFLAAGWALVAVSIGVAWVLFLVLPPKAD